METRFTPGPWMRDPEDKLRITTEELLNAGDYIATVETYADARFIAAAPDLYAALEAMLEVHGVTQEYADKHIEIPQSWVEVSEIARAALKRARGE